MAEALRLKAVDREDLTIIASCLQDALVLVGDMVFLPDVQRFVLVANRFGWEKASPHADERDRVTCGITFGNVSAVRKRGFDLHESDRILALLTIQPAEGAIDLIFSGDSAIRLETTQILCHLEDVGEPWPTQWRPSHERR
jgi:Protein of unknown function (DUF2948)